MTRAVARIIRMEHTQISAVLYALKEAVEAMRREPGGDLALLRACLDYLATCSWRWHHPKEDLLMQAYLDLGGGEARELVDRIIAEHREGHARFAAIEALFAALQAGQGDRPAFCRACEAYIAAEWAHMHEEDHELMPRLEAVLDEDRWSRLAQAFQALDHPELGLRPADEAHRLYQRILELAAAPLGLGPLPTPRT